MKSACPLDNDFIDEFSGRIKKVIEEYEDGDPIFLKPTEKERRIIPLSHDNIFKDVQAFLEHKKGTKMKRKAWFSLKICCFLAKCYQKQSLSTVIHWQEQKQGDQQKLRGHLS